MQDADRWLAERYPAVFNEEFAVPTVESGADCVPFLGPGPIGLPFEHHGRTVSRDDCVSFQGERTRAPACRSRKSDHTAAWRHGYGCIVTPAGA